MIIDNGARLNNSVYSAENTAKAVDTKPKTVDMPTEMTDTAANAAAAMAAEVRNVSPQNPAQERLAGQQDPKVTDENDSRKLKDAVGHANQTMRHSKTRCEFSYHEETKRVSIKVIDSETDDVIREIPPEETLDMLSKMWELAGLMVDEKR